jgi:hypothetical protein
VTWKPVRETYCHKCRKMVAAVGMESRPIPDTHFMFSTKDNYGRRSGPYKLCTGWRGYRGITHGMEDPRAAFHTRPLAQFQTITNQTDEVTVELRAT